MLAVMEISEITWSDATGVRRFAEVTNAVRRADSPWVHPMTVRECEGALRHGWDGEPAAAYVATADGAVVAVGEYEVSSYDNLHLAWLAVDVHPDHRRRGHGSELLRELVDLARREGRTSVGIDSWDADGPRRFAARHGLDQKAADVNRRQFLPELDHAALDELFVASRPHAEAYELERCAVPTAPADLAAMAVMVAAINDAPTDDLDIEDEAFPPERIAAYETAQLARGMTLHRVVARHRETGELAGHTVVVVDGERPQLAEQHDTAVVAAHRGHRLGLLLKLEMLRWLSEAEPQVTSVDTWNAESNDHMIGVNRVLGYRVMGRGLSYQRSI
jgi:GNAT superfamily N-acetyltransferase